MPPPQSDPQIMFVRTSACVKLRLKPTREKLITPFEPGYFSSNLVHAVSSLCLGNRVAICCLDHQGCNPDDIRACWLLAVAAHSEQIYLASARLWRSGVHLLFFNILDTALVSHQTGSDVARHSCFQFGVGDCYRFARNILFDGLVINATQSNKSLDRSGVRLFSIR